MSKNTPEETPLHHGQPMWATSKHRFPYTAVWKCRICGYMKPRKEEKEQ